MICALSSGARFGTAALWAEAHALLSVPEFEVGNFDPAAVRERLPVGLEVLALEPASTNLLGKEAIDNRVIDVFQEVTVDPLVDRTRDAVGIDQQDCYSRLARCRCGSLRQAG